jgi:hypothetical protein
MVPKKDGSGRLVLDGRPLNDLMVPPPPMAVERMPDIIRTILRMKKAFVLDATSFFYQIEIHPHIAPFFGVDLRHARGPKSYRMCLSVLCMGWSYAPAIAQAVSNTFIRNLFAVAFVDNFVVDESAYEEFRARCEKYECEVHLLAEGQKFEALGLDFDLEDQTFGACQTIQREVQRNALSLQQNTTVRDLLVVLGYISFLTFVSGTPIAEPSIQRAFATLEGVRVLELSDRAPIDKDTATHVAAVATRLASTRFRAIAHPNHDAVVVAFSDASEIAAGAVIFQDPVKVQTQMFTPSQAPLSIYAKEAIAAAWTTSIATTDRCAWLHLFVDNRALYFALKKGHGENLANQAIAEIKSISSKWGGLSVGWCPSKCNFADDPSRNKELECRPTCDDPRCDFHHGATLQPHWTYFEPASRPTNISSLDIRDRSSP